MKLIVGCIICIMMFWIEESSAQDSLFAPAVNYYVGVFPSAVTAADLNGDGYDDFAVTDYMIYRVYIFINNGAGSFDSPSDYYIGQFPRSIFAADLDGDGHKDLAVANALQPGPGTVSVCLNNSDGTFRTRLPYEVGNTPYSMFAADLDGDADIELMAANYYAFAVSILFNDGTGSFPIRRDYPTGNMPYSIFSSDFDGDGYNDIAVASLDSNTVTILINNGNGGFLRRVVYVAGTNPKSIIAADFDDDGDDDLVTANHGISILINNGNGTFQAYQIYGAGCHFTSVIAGDFDNDNDLDVAASDDSLNNVTIFINNGDGTFQQGGSYPVESRPWSISAGDFGNDGDFDLVTANSGSENVSVLMNVMGPPPNGAIRGIVTESSTGLPLEGCIVHALHYNYPRGADTSGADGSYLISNLRTVHHRIKVSKSGYITGFSEVVQISADETTEVNIALAHEGPVPCSYIPGDINGEGIADGIDIVYGVNYLMNVDHPPAKDCGFPVGPCPENSPFYSAGDVNGNCAFNGVDIAFFVRYLKLQTPNLLYCPDCPPAP